MPGPSIHIACLHCIVFLKETKPLIPIYEILINNVSSIKGGKEYSPSIPHSEVSLNSVIDLHLLAKIKNKKSHNVKSNMARQYIDINLINRLGLERVHLLMIYVAIILVQDW